MKPERSTQSLVVVALVLAMVAGCDQFGSEKKVKIANPTCEDLGKITDDAEHKALLAKCPGYMRGGNKKSVPQEW